MKAYRRFFFLLGIVSLFALQPSSLLKAATTINNTNQFSYGANLGWMDWRGDTNNGAIIGEYVCSGYVWSANVGWIHLGNGTPANGIRYQNNSATDYGVNHDGHGGLYGFAWSPNIGWINFAPSVDLKTGKLSGYLYSANCGWIVLSNAFAQVQTDSLPATDSDGDGIADAWELTYTNTLAAFSASSDTDGDGVSDKDEYLADTSPINPIDYLHITSFTYGSPTPAHGILSWTAKSTRFYAIESNTNMTNGWTEFLGFSQSGIGTASFDDNSTNAFYRIRANRPLTP